MAFSAGVEHARYVRLSGELTLSSVATLRRALGGGHVLVDCSDLTAVDADAVGVLGEIHAALREVGCELVVYRAHGGLLREAQLRGFSFV